MLPTDLSAGGTHRSSLRFRRIRGSQKASDLKEARTTRTEVRTSCKSYRLRPRTLRERRSTSRRHRPSPYSSSKNMCPRMPGRPLPNVAGEARAQATPATKSTHLRVATVPVESLRRALGCPTRLSFTANAMAVIVILRRLKHHHPLITRALSPARPRPPLPRRPIARPTTLPPRTASQRAPTTTDLQPRPRPSPPPSPASCTRTLHHPARPTVARRPKKSTPTLTAPTVGETAMRAHSRFLPVPASEVLVVAGCAARTLVSLPAPLS